MDVNHKAVMADLAQRPLSARRQELQRIAAVLAEKIPLDAAPAMRPDVDLPPPLDAQLAEWREVEAIVDSPTVLAVFAAPEWAELSEDGHLWVRAIVREARRRALPGPVDLDAAAMRAVEGR